MAGRHYTRQVTDGQKILSASAAKAQLMDRTQMFHAIDHDSPKPLICSRSMRNLYLYMAVALCALQQAGFVWGVEETEPPPLPTPSPGEREEALARYYTDTLIRSQVTDQLKVHRIL